MDIINPLVEWRLHHGLSRRSLALAAGIAYSSVYAVEAGTATRLHPRIVSLIEATEGLQSAIQVEASWRDWRNHLAQTTRQMLVQ